MSYILDALNKSEQERKLQSGQGAQQQAVYHGNAEFIHAKKPLWLILSVAAVGIVIILLWLQRTSQSVITHSVITHPVITQSTIERQQPVDSQDILQNAAHPEATIKQRNVQPMATVNLSAVKQPAKPTQIFSAPQDVAALYQNKITNELNDNQLTDNQLTGNNPNQQHLGNTQSQVTQADSNPQTSPAQTQVLPKTAKGEIDYEKVALAIAKEINVLHSSQNTQASRSAKRHGAATNHYIPPIYDLPIDLQKQIPTIDYSAHVYAMDEASGFVVLNGRSRRPGDHLNSDIVVEKITEAGVVLSFRGTEFTLDSMRSWVND